MRKSENFDLNLYEGTDIFNPLTTDVPNYEKIDAQMEKNYNLSVGKATELKTGTVHALTRENADCPMIHFTATSNFTSNDTFTVDGVQVSALLVDGSTLPTNCYIIGSEVICYLKGALLTFFLSGSVSKDSEKLGGEFPSYYAKQESFEQLETSVNSMSGVIEKNSNDIIEINTKLDGLSFHHGTMTQSSDVAGRVRLVGIPKDAIGIILNVVDGSLNTLTNPTIFSDNIWRTVLMKDNEFRFLQNTSVVINYSYWTSN